MQTLVFRTKDPSADAAQSVRMMLARHHYGSTSKLFTGGGGEMAEAENERNESSSSDHFSSAVLPGDSFPATEQHLLPAHSFEDDDVDGEEEGDGSSEDEREILRRLGQSQARMEQVRAIRKASTYNES